MEFYYASDDYISHTNEATGLINKLYLIARNFTMKQKLKLITQHALHLNKILDYGCGTGEFLKTCHVQGLQAFGIEPSTQARKHIISELQPRVYSDLQYLKEVEFSHITLWHVLEHVEDPNLTLKNLRARLQKNGTIFIAVPNHESYDARKYKQHWAGYDVPRHLWHFSQSSMRTLLENNELKLVNTQPMILDSFYVSILSEKYINNNKNSLRGLLKAFLTGIQSNIKARAKQNYSSLIYIAQQ
jgi:SAM-dependent methyltransferase